MNEQTEKLLDLLGDVLVNSSKIEDGGKVTISRQDYNGLHIRLAKACKEAGLKFTEVKVEMCRNYNPRVTLNCMIPNHRGGLRCHLITDCDSYEPSEYQIKEIEVE